MILVDRDDILKMLVEESGIPAYTFKKLDEKLHDESYIPVRAVIKDCNGCMGGSFNDCPICNEIVISKGDNNES